MAEGGQSLPSSGETIVPAWNVSGRGMAQNFLFRMAMMVVGVATDHGEVRRKIKGTPACVKTCFFPWNSIGAAEGRLGQIAKTCRLFSWQLEVLEAHCKNF